MALVNLYIWHLIFDFMWNGKGDKIKRNVMINLHEKNIINTEIMWLNSHIKVDRRPICNVLKVTYGG